MFHIKDLDILNLDPNLQAVVLAVEDRFGLDIVTSAFRPGDKGVHGQMPLRGLDLRCRDKLVGNHVAGWVNRRWQYDPDRPEKMCAMCHDTGRGLHLHFQSHSRTELIERRW